jgi:hypothetical protein
MGLQGPGAVRLSYFKANAEASFTVVGTVNELTIEARCHLQTNDTLLGVRLTSSVQAGVDFSAFTNNFDDPADTLYGGAALPAGTPITFNADALSPISGPDQGAGGTDVELKVVEMIYNNAGRTIAVNMLVESDAIDSSCHINGVAVPAS